MLDRITGWMYRRLGSRYWLVLVAGEGGVSVFVALLTIAIIVSYYDPTFLEFATLAGAGSGLTLLAVLFAAARARPVLDTIVGWRRMEAPTAGATVAAWEAATTFTLRQYRRDSWRVNLFAVVPTCALAVHVLDLRWPDFFVVLLACVIPAAYATVLSYSVGEALARPMVADIADVLPDDFPFERHGLPVSKRLRIGLPAYTAFSGVVVASLVGDRGGSSALVLAVVVAMMVGLALSHELALLLARGITQPISEVRRALDRVRAEDFAARVPVTTSDELGELAHDFNLMARGLEEREQMRAAFGTYMDKAVAGLILSGQFPDEGVEIDVSIMFCDVRGFTSYAENAEATEVIATLNQLFEVMVPIVDRHGGHVDKFIGDGLLAVFGAPEAYPDHADRAVAAAREIVAAVNAGDTGLRVGVGVNTGRVVAGSIGGAGRLNFSVIGDAVNVAARVEAATRQTGDDVLITAATRDLLLGGLAMVSRGTVPLKGKAEPLEVFAPPALLDSDKKLPVRP
ncbi:adenylate/guanylate cyclase domain-containing protein [Nocardioides sp.]|uniref:adenylate/guanylate cyclase domain-containing protein n=1 Tax=Nocardioides sp. TaxID=35761 RepID=UPI0031FF1B48